jgi:uncharacterized membrane protein
MAIVAYSTLGHVLERHVANRALDSSKAEGVLSEVWTRVSRGFPYYGISPILVILAVVLIVLAFVAYSVAGKGSGSHAGREEVRRAYRRKLAQEMAREDAAKIRTGEKPRRRWMQW